MGEIAPQEQFLLFSTIFCNLILDFCVKTRSRFSLRDKRLFEIIEVEITRVDCINFLNEYISLIQHQCGIEKKLLIETALSGVYMPILHVFYIQQS